VCVESTDPDRVANVLTGPGVTSDADNQDAEVSWIVLSDPDGNEFCVLRPLAEGSPV
jgi:hypothetical protein